MSFWSVVNLARGLQPYRHMLDWSVVFFALSFVAALLGFIGLAAAAATLAQVLFYSLITMVALGLLGSLLGGGVP